MAPNRRKTCDCGARSPAERRPVPGALGRGGWAFRVGRGEAPPRHRAKPESALAGSGGTTLRVAVKDVLLSI
ncbi:hypothetical protein AGIG_G10930 [Arapaima gigas]